MHLRILILVLLLSSCVNRKADQIANPILTDSTTNLSISDSLIRGERIDGPANIRDTVNGKLMFTLFDNVLVTATDPVNKWLQVGVVADISQQEMNSNKITAGSVIHINGKPAGKANTDIPLYGAFTTNEGKFGELVGFTSEQNIKPATIIENVFTALLKGNKEAVTKKQLDHFLKDFEFQTFDSLCQGCQGYMIYENWIEDPSPLLRLWLIFKENKLIGVFHSRSLDLQDFSAKSVERGFSFTAFSNDTLLNKNLTEAFQSFIRQVD